MAFDQQPLSFQPGIYANRSKRASQGRWVNGNNVRFPDGVPASIGGYVTAPVVGDTLTGKARDMFPWRPNNQVGRYAFIGTHSNAYVFDGGSLDDITPVGFVAGRESSVTASGYGTGLYGKETYGSARSMGTSALDAAMWTSDKWGEVLIACYNGDADGVIYDFELGVDTTLQVLTNAPAANCICVSDERAIFAFGCDGDPSMVKWSDRDDRTDWTPGTGDRSGFYQMQNETPFQCGHRCRGSVLAWTKTELFEFAPLGNSLVYNRERLGSNCGVMGSQAACVVTNRLGDVAYWMSPHGFYAFDGLVQQLDCELQDYVFNDINIVQRAKFQARPNVTWSEVWFWYCSAEADEIDRAVIYNYKLGIWYKSDIARVAWMDSGIFNNPYGISAAGVIYEHESGETAAGAVLSTYILSHPITLGVGQQLMYVDAFWPDMQEGSDTCQFSMVIRYAPGGADTLIGPYNFETSDEKLDLTVEAREVQIRIDGVAGAWELGQPLLSVQMAGGR